jgi:4-oxalocrotonate tautomerase
MPHVIVKMYRGRSEAEKQRLATAVTEAVTSSLGYKEDSVSVAIEDVAPEDWMKDVYDPDIQSKSDRLYKKPGYGPLR